MGKTKTAFIDDSKPHAEEPKKKKLNPNPELEEKKPAKKLNPNPELAEKKPVISSDSERRLEEASTLGVKSQDSENKIATPSARNDVKKGKTAKEDKVSKRAQKKGTLKYRSKKYLEAREKVEKTKRYPLAEAVELAKTASYSKFGGSLEIHINTSVKNIRGLVNLPFASGKKLKVIAFGKGAENSGADIIGSDDDLKEIEKGRINFDILVVSPDIMPRLARFAKVLGPRGLMPNPKNGTISSDLKKAVAEIQGGKTEYKTQKDSQVIHLSLGALSRPSEELVQNAKILLNTIGKTKSKKVTLAPSMGPGVKVDLSSI